MAQEKPAEAVSPEAAAEEETKLKGFDPTDLPTPGKHQLRPTPLQIANHRIMRLAERITAQNERIAALETATATQKEQITRQQEALDERAKTVAALESRLQAMFEQIATVSRQVENVEARTASQAQPQRVQRSAPTVTVRQHDSGGEPIPRAQPVNPEEFARLQQSAQQGGEQAPATPAPTPVPVEPPPPGSTVYTIKRGDNLTIIARTHGTTVAEILKINPIADERKLQIGQQLHIPPQPNQQPDEAPASSATPASPQP